MPAFDPHRNPIQQYLTAAARAQQEGVDTAPAALATVDADGRPSLRIVLLRGVDDRGFVFYTNYGSRKARELDSTGRAALCQHWPTLEEQVRIEGRVERATEAESDAYFATRPRESQIGAWASEQSRPLPGREILEERIREVEARFEGQPVTRPPFWGGFRVIPESIEFWYGRPGRLHDRLLYVRAAEGWRTGFLYP